MPESFHPIFRKIQEHELWKDKPYTRGQAWIDMILCADYKTGEIEGSHKYWSDRWGWTRQKVRSFFEYLLREKMASQNHHEKEQTTNPTTKLKLCKYLDYTTRATNPTTNPEEIEIILKDFTYYTIGPHLIEQFQKAYSNIDVVKELYKIVAWNRANPKRRKTRVGILRHVNFWLARTNDKVGPKQKSRYDFQQCGHCGLQTNTVKKGKPCPMCDEIA